MLDKNLVEEPYENTALNFSKLLINNDFTAAYALLSPSAQLTLSLADLEKTYTDMVSNFKTPANNAEVVEALADWVAQEHLETILGTNPLRVFWGNSPATANP